MTPLNQKWMSVSHANPLLISKQNVMEDVKGAFLILLLAYCSVQGCNMFQHCSSRHCLFVGTVNFYRGMLLFMVEWTATCEY